ncbi:MAG: hypothetical protein ACQEP9_00775 [Bacillota bacterium]
MGRNKVDNHFLEGFLDVATELLAYSKNQNNRATPSLNDFAQFNQSEQNIIISNEEADQILDILDELQEQIEGKEEKINQLESELNQKESIIKEKEQLETKRDYHQDSDFEAELREHADTLDLITVVVQSGSNCSDLLGNVFRVYNDFVVLLGEKNNLVKIVLDKIVAIKIINNKTGQENKSSDCEPSDNTQFEEKSDKQQEKNLEAV